MRRRLVILLMAIICFLLLLLLLVFLHVVSFLLEPDYVRHYNRGLNYHNQGKLDKAIEKYKTAILLERNHYVEDAHPTYEASIHYNMGHAYKAQGKLDEAVAAYKKAIDIDPSLETPQLREFINSHASTQE